MNTQNEESGLYVTLYEFLGRASTRSGIGREVYKTAKEQKIPVGSKELPKDLQRDDYREVLTYPLTFLREYFKDDPQLESIVRNGDLVDITYRLSNIQNSLDLIFNRLSTLEKKINNHDELNDDLPF